MFITNFDYISPDITLYYNGSSKHSSIFSGILSIFLTMFAVIFGYFISMDFLFHKNPTSFYFRKSYKNIPVFSLNSNNFFHYVTLINSKEEYADFNLSHHFVFGFQNINLTNIQTFNSLENETIWIYEQCQEDDYSEYNKFFSSDEKTILEHSFCIAKMNKSGIIYSKYDKEFEYPILGHGVSTNENIDYAIIISPCINSSYTNNSCERIDIINEKIKYYLFSLHYLSFYIEINDYKNQFVYFPMNDSVNIFPSTYISVYVENYYPVELDTNDGIIFDNNVVKTKYYHNGRVSKYIANKEYYAGYTFKLENLGECYNRTYKKLQDIAGGIDGIIQLFILFFQIFNSIVYHDFQVINDFNKIIEEKVVKIKIATLNTLKNESFSMKKKKNKLQESNLNFIEPYSSINNPNSMNATDKNIKINTFLKVNETKVSHELGEFNHKLSQNFKVITWPQYFFNQFKCIRKNVYIKNIEGMREEMLSEERMFKNFFYIKNLKEKVYLGNNFMNNIEPLSNMKSLKSLKIPI